MDKHVNKLISNLFSDPIYIEILCSIYENEVTASSIASLIDLKENEVIQKLDTLVKNNLVYRKPKGQFYVYSLANPKVCDSILNLKDSFQSICNVQ
ncbi:MAG: winged helix-turn-helix domain-containing protein [Bacteroidota bacterium]